ncbi:hypothetical protein DSO57_1037788 [Entomophthora muscae]|uniref:Uncharacterized protein n=1 Tax=Entomophthora muscae TaxID=34485 RepID=A0ACC2SBK7_9FUNG|nr:hypothetical protein DSO57_1037788 [Entomophthora muscae]
MTKLHSLLKISQLEPHLAIKSHLPPLELAWFRTIAAGICCVVLMTDIVYHFSTPICFIKFLTGFGFYGIIAYLTISAYFSWKSVKNPETYRPSSMAGTGVRLAYTLLYQSSCVISFIISLVYWILIAPKEITTYSNTRLFISLQDTCFKSFDDFADDPSRNIFILTHMSYLHPYHYALIPYTFIIHPIDNEWPYFFFDYKKETVLFACVVVGVIISSALLQFYSYASIPSGIYAWKSSPSKALFDVFAF